MRKILFFIALAASAAGLISCSTVTKSKDLKTDTIKCGQETTVWESLPASARNAYDVTVSFKKGVCHRRVIVQDNKGAMTTNDVAKSKPQTYTGATKITLQCVETDAAIADQCAFTVNDVRTSPTDPKATVTINAGSSPTTVPCGTTAVAFTATNTAGADVTVLWRSGSPCNATMTAIRALADGKTATNTFIHNTKVDKELSSIRDALKITVECSGGGSAVVTDCDFEIVETEYP